MDFFSLQKAWLLSLPRTPFWDAFFRLCTFFDSEYFVFTLIPLLWYGISRKKGIYLFYLLAFSALLNTFFKDTFAFPRPCTANPLIALVRAPLSYGFPSGAAQTAFFLGLLLWNYSKKLRFLSLFYILVVSFSRLYLRVHYPIDILGGWVLGAAVFYAYQRLLPYYQKFTLEKPLFIQLRWGILLPLLLGILYPDPRVTYVMNAAMGVSMGNFFFEKNNLSENPTILKGILSIGICFLGFFLFSALPISLNHRAFFLGIWIALLPPYLLEKGIKLPLRR